ncbi:MAG: glycerol-3-phosphate acyltransferase [Asgard group archaeon]|nr:glycerol-3-phosphate acyltransferase [Asgard group archaeon]
MSFANIWPFFVSAIIGYLIGGIPTAYIITKTVTGIAPQNFGSGSVSTRNTIRATGLFPGGTITFSVDSIKGMFAVAIVEYAIAPFAEDPAIFTEYYVIVCAFMAVIAHCWMPYLSFQGGKGLGTYVGLLFYFYWPAAFYWIFMLFLLIKLSGFSGIGACWSAITVPPFFYLIDVITTKLSMTTLPIAFWPHTYFNDGLFGWSFILLYAVGMWIILVLRHIPEFRKIKRGDAQAWKSLKTDEMLK